MDAELRDELREMLRQMARMSGEAKESVRGATITKTTKNGGFEWRIVQDGVTADGSDTASVLAQFEHTLGYLAARAEARAFRG